MTKNKFILALSLFLIPLLANSADSILTLSNIQGITITGGKYTSATGNCISLTNVKDITITGATFTNCFSAGIRVDNGTNININNNTFDTIGSGATIVVGTTIKVDNNRFKNVSRRLGANNGQFVQFNQVTGSGNSVSNNIGYNIPGQCNPEDLISMYKSSGLPGDNIIISGNSFMGGGLSTSGGGIILGDNGGDSITAINNILINPGQYGMTVAGGNNMTIQNNRVYSQQTANSNVGISTWAQAGFTSDTVKVIDNVVQWTNKNGVINNYWNQGNVTNLTFSNNKTGDLNSLLVPIF